LTNNELQSANFGQPIVVWKRSWTQHRHNTDFDSVRTLRRRDALTELDTPLPGLKPRQYCAAITQYPPKPPRVRPLTIMSKAVAPPGISSRPLTTVWASVDALPLRLGRSCLLWSDPIIKSAAALARRDDRSGGKLSRIFIGECSLFKRSCIRATITQSAGPPTRLHVRSPYG
jgi:hypothetical protein